MNNFEKFKADLTIERLADMLANTLCVAACKHCAYDVGTCEAACEYGIKEWLESEAE